MRHNRSTAIRRVKVRVNIVNVNDARIKTSIVVVLRRRQRALFVNETWHTHRVRKPHVQRHVNITHVSFNVPSGSVKSDSDSQRFSHTTDNPFPSWWRTQQHSWVTTESTPHPTRKSMSKLIRIAKTAIRRSYNHSKSVESYLTLDLRSSGTIDASGGQRSPNFSVNGELWYIIPIGTSTSDVLLHRLNPVHARPTRLSFAAGWCPVECRPG